jgi:ATP-dependent RNA helicase DeaD
VTRQEVGRIQVMERETRVEIASWAATRFTDAARHQEADDEDIRIEPMRGPAIPHGRGARHTRAASPRR